MHESAVNIDMLVAPADKIPLLARLHKRDLYKPRGGDAVACCTEEAAREAEANGWTEITSEACGCRVFEVPKRGRRK